ncbi:NAD-dependent protein deacylase [Tumebacillus algifaecis]|uniref:protein acetyllysine N-acetyltransferase n=1 Tax=Tumebacillus algifaecis TaxID=1214604 RepID=A0A223D4S9_9BACL|nr:NAD-dependent deacylase [Tumebacillus algifaecis]ASS76443.1 NAD-dependent protein deacylase [Tumebacillus algifaecis]
MEAIQTLARWIKESRYTVVLTGAGMSTESGLPDFRSASGWWQNIDPRTVATVEALESNYRLFQEFYAMRIRGLDVCKPHRGHHILAEWEQRGFLHSVATQNVDGFHQQAGSQQVYELHGSLRTVRCNTCAHQTAQTDFLAGKACPLCQGKLRPDVVLFGEQLPALPWQRALNDMRSAELMVVIGTSLQVYPVAQLPMMTQGRLVMLNAEPTEHDDRFDLVVTGKAGELLQALNSQL